MANIVFGQTTTVNGISIETTIDFRKIDGKNVEVNMFPELFKIDKLGRTCFWRVYVIEDQYFKESGILGGKVKTYNPVRATPKNIGKSNETNGFTQAIFEAYSDWKHKKDQLYTQDTPGQVEKVDIGSRLRPMLAEKFTDQKHNVKYPCAVSRKLDGLRCMIYHDEEGVQILSRLGKKYQHFNGIRTEADTLMKQYPDVVLDGELYSHNIPFNAISGAARSQSKPSKYDNNLEYYIFDLYIPAQPDISYKDRVALMKEMANGKFSRLKFVYYEEVKSEDEIKEKHAQYVSEGYEGLMIRNLSSVYRLGRRVKDLLKYKEFEDAEFKVVDVVEGMGSEVGAAVFTCVTPDGKDTFNVRPRGSIEKRRIQFKNKSKYIGKMLTVRYQPISKETCLPRFPVGIKFANKVEDGLFEGVDFRDYE